MFRKLWFFDSFKQSAIKFSTVIYILKMACTTCSQTDVTYKKATWPFPCMGKNNYNIGSFCSLFFYTSVYSNKIDGKRWK